MTPRSIPDDQVEEVLRLIGFGFTDEGIAYRYGCSRQTVINFRNIHGIEKKRVGRRPRMRAETLSGGEKPIRIYYDAALDHFVRVFSPRYCSYDETSSDLPYNEEIECVDPTTAA